jgi:hypothetical protein
MNSEKYIGLDVHQATIVVAVTDSSGKLIMESILETEAATILQHRALEEFGWTGEIEEFNQAARLNHLSVTDPILITTSGTILSGFGRWQSAVFNGLFEINCIEYPFNEDESLQFILTNHQTRSGWNDFVCINHARFIWCPSATQNTAVEPAATNRLAPNSNRKSIVLLRFFPSSPTALAIEPRFQLGTESVCEHEVRASGASIRCCRTHVWCRSGCPVGYCVKRGNVGCRFRRRGRREFPNIVHVGRELSCVIRSSVHDCNYRWSVGLNSTLDLFQRSGRSIRK